MYYNNQYNYINNTLMNCNPNYFFQQMQTNNMNCIQNNMNSFPVQMNYNNYSSNNICPPNNPIYLDQVALMQNFNNNMNCNPNMMNYPMNMNNQMQQSQTPMSMSSSIKNNMNNSNNSINIDINPNLSNSIINMSLSDIDSININNNKNENNNSAKNINSKNENENNQEKVNIKEQNKNENDNVIQNNETNEQNVSKDNKSDTNKLGNDNKNDSNQINSPFKNNNTNDNSSTESIKQSENISEQKDKIDGNADSNKSNINKNKINENEQSKNNLISKNNSDSTNNDKNHDKINKKEEDQNKNDNNDSNNNDKNHNKINENKEKNKNDNSANKLNEIKTNNEIKEYKDIYPNISEEKINIIFVMPNNEKKGFKIPLNLTRAEIYYTAYKLCENQKGEFEYKTLLKLIYKGNMLINDDSKENLKNEDEIIIEQCLICYCLDFHDLIHGKTSNIKKHFIFSDSSNQIISADLPGDITITEILEFINSVYNKLLDSNRIKCEIYFNKKILEKKDKQIRNVVRFNKINDVNINIVIRNLVCLQKKPGKILKVEIQESDKFITEVSIGTFEKIKDFLEDLNNELAKYKIKSFTPYFENKGKRLDLKNNDERTFFSIDVKNNFNCILSSLVRRFSFFGK